MIALAKYKLKWCIYLPYLILLIYFYSDGSSTGGKNTTDADARCCTGPPNPPPPQLRPVQQPAIINFEVIYFFSLQTNRCT